MFLYDSTLKKVNTKIEILNNEFADRYDYNPIEHIKSRLKSTENVVMKLKKGGCRVTTENMMERLSGIAGTRIICSFTSDIYQIADMITAQGDVTAFHVRDYTKSPKSNGHESCHMVVIASVYLTDRPMETKVEIQIHSVTMDSWVSPEHKIVYKFEGSTPESLPKELEACADMADILDTKMFSLNEAIMAFAREQKERSGES